MKLFFATLFAAAHAQYSCFGTTSDCSSVSCSEFVSGACNSLPGTSYYAKIDCTGLNWVTTVHGGSTCAAAAASANGTDASTCSPLVLGYYVQVNCEVGATPSPTSAAPTPSPTSAAPTTSPTSAAPTVSPTTGAPTAPTTLAPTAAPNDATTAPTVAPTVAPTAAPTEDDNSTDTNNTNTKPSVSSAAMVLPSFILGVACLL